MCSRIGERSYPRPAQFSHVDTNARRLLLRRVACRSPCSAGVGCRTGRLVPLRVLLSSSTPHLMLRGCTGEGGERPDRSRSRGPTWGFPSEGGQGPTPSSCATCANVSGVLGKLVGAEAGRREPHPRSRSYPWSGLPLPSFGRRSALFGTFTHLSSYPGTRPLPS